MRMWPITGILTLVLLSACTTPPEIKQALATKDQAYAENERLMQQYRDAFSSPYMAAGRRLLDTIIEPGETRAYLAANLRTLNTKRELRPSKKHGLIPL